MSTNRWTSVGLAPPPNPPRPPPPPGRRPPGSCCAKTCAPAGSIAAAALPVDTAVCTKILFPHTIGEDDPAPGTFTFHLTFFPCSQDVGGSPAGATPLAKGPRQAGQFPSAPPPPPPAPPTPPPPPPTPPPPPPPPPTLSPPPP